MFLKFYLMLTKADFFLSSNLVAINSGVRTSATCIYNAIALPIELLRYRLVISLSSLTYNMLYFTYLIYILTSTLIYFFWQRTSTLISISLIF
jgi:hypothetical protein